jgi:small conductance mechanosensitive channel
LHPSGAITAIELPLWTQAAIRSGLRLAGILLAALLLVRLLRALTSRLVQLATTDSRAAVLREEHTRRLAALLSSIGSAVIFTAAALTALAEFGINVTPVAATAGLATLGLGLGAQNFLRDVISGFLVVFEDQYGVGETIRTGGITGRVESITLRRTVLRDAQGAIITLPNGDIRQVANLSRDWSQAYVDVPVPGWMDLDNAFQALEKASAQMRKDEAWSAALLDGPRLLGVESLGVQATMLRLQLRTPPTRQHDVARELRRRIMQELGRAIPAKEMPQD